jgi:hypothetical protein
MERDVKVRVDADDGPLTMDDLADGRTEGWKADAFERGSVCTLERLPVGGWRISSRIWVLCI